MRPVSQPGRAPRGWGDFAPRSVLARPGRCGVTRSGVWRPRVWAVPCPCRGLRHVGGHAPLPPVGLPGRVGGQRGPAAHRRQRRRPDGELVRTAGCWWWGVWRAVRGGLWCHLAVQPPGETGRSFQKWRPNGAEVRTSVATLQEVEGVAREPGRPVDMGAGPGVPLERTPVGPPTRSGLPPRGQSLGTSGSVNAALRMFAVGAEPRARQGHLRVCPWHRTGKTHEAKPGPLGRGDPGCRQCLAGESRGGGRVTCGLRPAHPCWC